MKTLVEVLSDNAQSDLQIGHKAVAVEPMTDGWLVTSNSADGEHQYRARQIVFSAPADVAAALLRPTHAALAGLLDRIEYAPIAQVHLGIDHNAFVKKPEGSGFLVPSRAGLPILGSLWRESVWEEGTA